MLIRRAILSGFFLLLLPLVALGALPPVASSSVSLDWASYNGNLQSTRFANIKVISTSNVSRLHVICTANVGGTLNFQTGPIVIAGVIYATVANKTVALNATTCGTIWVNTYATTSVTQQNRGIAYLGGVLYRGFTDGHMVAIEAANGATLWNTKVTALGSVERIVAAPLAWNGRVYIGTSNSDTAQVCHVMALNASTGAIVWSKQTVPNIGDADASTWQSATNIAGGSMWTSFSIDPSSSSLYVPIGNPEPDFDSRARIGQNLYTNSIVALDAATGVLKGGLQVLPADVHDWDQSAAPASVTLSSGARVLLTAGKDGYLRSVKTSTFATNWKTPVTTIANATAPISTSGTHYCPAGAVLWNGPAYSPANGLAFVNAGDRCTTVALAPSPQPYEAGHAWTGTTNGFGNPDAAQSGWLSAINATSGAVVWRYHDRLPLVAGVTPTSGNLVFTADLQGNVLAFNATSGALLANVATTLPAGGGVVTYEVNGKQYVAVAAGISSANFGTSSASSSVVVLGI